jgi:hypothetical protein
VEIDLGKKPRKSLAVGKTGRSKTLKTPTVPEPLLPRFWLLGTEVGEWASRRRKIMGWESGRLGKGKMDTFLSMEEKAGGGEGARRKGEMGRRNQGVIAGVVMKTKHI